MKCCKHTQLLILMLIFGCNSVDPIPPTQIQPTAIRTFAPVPTTLPTSTQTVKPLLMTTEPPPTHAPAATLILTKNVPTVATTSTTVPTAEPTETPQPIILIPGWVSDPSQNVFMVSLDELTNGRDLSLTLINPATGEKFAMPKIGSSSTKWLIEEDRLFIELQPAIPSGVAAGELTRELIDVSTGEILQRSLSGIKVNDALSGDGNKLVYVENNDEGLRQAKLLDIEMDDEILLPDLFDGRYSEHTTVAWSADERFIATLQIDFPVEQYGESGYGLAIYTDIGEPYRLYDSVTTNYWSPTMPNRILYTELKNRQRACVLDIESSERNCLDAIEEWKDFRGNNVGIFRWLPDGQHISFVYWEYDKKKTGLCVLEIESSEIDCPIVTADIVGLFEEGFFVSSHFWSPDQKFVTIFYTPSTPIGHDRTFTRVAVYNTEQSVLKDFGWGYSPSLESAIWRPDISGE